MRTTEKADWLAEPVAEVLISPTLLHMTARLHRRALCPTASADEGNSTFQLRQRGGAIEPSNLFCFPLAGTAALLEHVTATA
jgi:hypothetical protein